ncbi:MAG: BamA/OMP85 family outer membrane protein, partial [Acidobacteriota bacterium]
VDSREAMALLFGGTQADAAALLSAELLGVTGRAVGLDTLRLERGFDADEFRADSLLIATETDPSARLTLSKRVRPDVELIFSQSLRDSGALSAVVSYKPRRNVELRAISRDNLDRSVALRHEITFGGSGDVTAVSDAARPTVTGITFEGDSEWSDEELRALLKLEVGEPFEFHRWQDDLDRLRAAYYERHYYEARVRGLRQVSEDGQSVALEYRITRGPVAELVFEGHPVERALEEEIRDAWTRTIFERFLLEDIRTRVLRHLMEQRYLDSRVDTEVSSTAAGKQIRVTVTAGTLVKARTIAFTGNARIEADRLETVVADAGLSVDGWLDPQRLVDPLVRYYRSQGYLSAAVTAGAPAVKGESGVLPVAIVEGPRFIIGTVSFPGVDASRIQAVTTAARLDTGVPYVTTAVDEARRRVEDLYAREGFNAVSVDIGSEANAEGGSVDVTVTILEGPQQVLREVTTQGATRTQEGVVTRALRLRLGDPVNLGVWSQARKRLYDTNVFRQVDIEAVPMSASPEEAAAGIEPVRAVVRVVEYPVWRLRYGGQVSDERIDFTGGNGRQQSLGILADLQNQNVFGRAITAGIAGRIERDRQVGSVFTSNGSFFGLPIRSSGFLFSSRQRFVVSEFASRIDERVGLSAEQRWRPFRLSEVIWTYRFQRTHTFDPDPGLLDFFPLDSVTKAARLGVTMFMDRRDDPSVPTTGWFTAANYEQAVRSLGSDFGNVRLLVQHSIFRQLGPAVLAGRAQAASAFGEEALVASERFLLGGATTVRGYGENALGPRDPFGLPGGGDTLLNFNAEARFPVWGWAQGVGFLDAGNIFARRGDLSFADLAVGYGFGLRLATPFAMVRVDFGIPARTLTPDRPANQFKSGRWYFGIGHIF